MKTQKTNKKQKNMDKNELLEKMHERGLKMCNLNHKIIRYTMLKEQLIDYQEDIDFCKAHLDYLHNAYDSCKSDYDKKSYSYQIYNTEQELYKAKKLLEKDLIKINENWYKKQIIAYKFINLAYRNLQKQYTKIIKIKNYESTN